MSLDQLLATLRRNAESDAAAARAAAELEVSRLRADAASRGTSRLAEALREAETQERRATALAIGAAWLAGEQHVLEARSRVLQRVFDEAMHRAAAWPWRAGERERLRQRLDAARALAGSRSSSVEEQEAGFVLTTTDGHLTIDDRFPARLERRRRELAQGVIRQLDHA